MGPERLLLVLRRGNHLMLLVAVCGLCFLTGIFLSSSSRLSTEPDGLGLALPMASLGVTSPPWSRSVMGAEEGRSVTGTGRNDREKNFSVGYELMSLF